MYVHTTPTKRNLGAQYTTTCKFMHESTKYMVHSACRNLLYVEGDKIILAHLLPHHVQLRFILFCFSQAKIKILTWIGNLRCFRPPTTTLADQNQALTLNFDLGIHVDTNLNSKLSMFFSHIIICFYTSPYC